MMYPLKVCNSPVLKALPMQLYALHTYEYTVDLEVGDNVHISVLASPMLSVAQQ